MKKEVYGYIRVSTVKQGEGASLDAQKSSIERFALENNLNVVQWFEEKQTAAKYGRPIFSKMLALLREKKVAGVIMHKIDRSARNLKDWVDVGELIDSGIEVHFSSETVDFNSRGGRLYADMRAVISTDFIRNQIEEVKKGLYGRLNQGIYPFKAPIGYLDTGGGNPKKIDENKASLVKRLFALYATGQYGIIALSNKMFDEGLTNRNGKKITRNGMATILSNPFYTGVIKLKKNGKVFEGIHEPIISKQLFDKVQLVLSGKAPNQKVRHNYLFRRRIKCGLCNRCLIAEKQKSYVYYRCQYKDCPTKTVREDVVEKVVIDFLESIVIKNSVIEEVREFFKETEINTESDNELKRREFNLELVTIQSREDTLAKKMIDGIIDDATYSKLKAEYLSRRVELKHLLKELEKLKSDNAKPYEFLELLKKLKQVYLLEDQEGKNDQKQEVLNFLTSNLYFTAGKISIQTHSVLVALSNMDEFSFCGHSRAQTRNFEPLPNTVDYKVTKLKPGEIRVNKVDKKDSTSLTKILCDHGGLDSIFVQGASICL